MLGSKHRGHHCPGLGPRVDLQVEQMAAYEENDGGRLPLTWAQTRKMSITHLVRVRLTCKLMLCSQPMLLHFCNVWNLFDGACRLSWRAWGWRASSPSRSERPSRTCTTKVCSLCFQLAQKWKRTCRASMCRSWKQQRQAWLALGVQQGHDDFREKLGTWQNSRCYLYIYAPYYTMK